MHIFSFLIFSTPFLQRVSVFLTAIFVRPRLIVLFATRLVRLNPFLKRFSFLIFPLCCCPILLLLCLYVHFILTLFRSELIFTLLYFAQKVLPLRRDTFLGLPSFLITILLLCLVIFIYLILEASFDILLVIIFSRGTHFFLISL